MGEQKVMFFLPCWYGFWFEGEVRRRRNAGDGWESRWGEHHEQLGCSYCTNSWSPQFRSKPFLVEQGNRHRITCDEEVSSGCVVSAFFKCFTASCPLLGAGVIQSTTPFLSKLRSSCVDRLLFNFLADLDANFLADLGRMNTVSANLSP